MVCLEMNSTDCIVGLMFQPLAHTIRVTTTFHRGPDRVSITEVATLDEALARSHANSASAVDRWKQVSQV